MVGGNGVGVAGIGVGATVGAGVRTVEVGVPGAIDGVGHGSFVAGAIDGVGPEGTGVGSSVGTGDGAGVRTTSGVRDTFDASLSAGFSEQLDSTIATDKPSGTAFRLRCTLFLSNTPLTGNRDVDQVQHADPPPKLPTPSKHRVHDHQVGRVGVRVEFQQVLSRPADRELEGEGAVPARNVEHVLV